MDQAILVGLNLSQNNEAVHVSLDELEQLGLALGIETKAKIIQNALRPTPKYYIGSGKVEEIKQLITIHDIDMVIFDDTLSPAQIKNLEKDLDVQVLDRSFLIMSVFAIRAQTKEAKLEVALAQKTYMLPRLVGMGHVLSRQGGGTFNAKGPGETQLELDRRKILREIYQIKQELAKIKKENEVSRKRRVKNQIPVVALVGYTNSGKSSLMNALSKKLEHPSDLVFEKDMLFATLSTKSKRLQKENMPPFILIDTVGFVDKLPVELIRSFEATLSDVTQADLLLHIVDGATFSEHHIDVTKMILTSIQADKIERILVLTKKDLATEIPIINDDSLFISNKTGENIDDLISAIYGHLYKGSRIFQLLIPFDSGHIYSELKTNNTILETQFKEDGTHLKAILT
ncbi:MAG: GTPase HflX, partial [Acholeplasmataceae bacterium]|nr:GTPase HflX [Acholeplasmataceae bacterium]